MDFVKKAVGGSGEKTDQNTQGGDKPDQGGDKPDQGGDKPDQGGDKADYVDKAFDFASKKSGHNVDPKMREQITDKGREAYESATGKKVNPKVSN